MLRAIISPANAILSRELELYRRALRDRTITTATDAAAVAAANVPSELSHQPFDVSAVGDNIVIAGAQGSAIHVHALMLWCAGDPCTIQLQDGALDLIGPIVAMPGTTGLFLPYSQEPHFKLTSGNGFNIRLTVGAAPRVTGFVQFRQVQG